MTDRQRRYAEIVALGTHSHTRAAKMAGYAPASARLSAYHNDKNPAVQSLVEKHREGGNGILSEDWVISNLIALARGTIPRLRGLGVRASRQTPWHVPDRKRNTCRALRTNWKLFNPQYRRRLKTLGHRSDFEGEFVMSEFLKQLSHGLKLVLVSFLLDRTRDLKSNGLIARPIRGPSIE